MLTQERLKQQLSYDAATGAFVWLASRQGVSAGAVAGKTIPLGYRVIRINKIAYRAHRLAWFYIYGVWPLNIDHINGLPSDNRLANLREATPSQNMQNQRRARSDNKTGLLGVSRSHRSHGSWDARITTGGVRSYIGCFPTPELAHAAYVEEKRKNHEFNTL